MKLLLIRLLNIPIVVAGRFLDVFLLVWHPRLLRAYLRIWWSEMVSSPYGWPRSFEMALILKNSGQTLHELMYGEITSWTASWLCFRAGVRSRSRVLDIGAGRGRLLIGVRCWGASARGIELQPNHVKRVETAMALAGIVLENADAKKVEWGNPTHLFLNWCAFSRETQAALTLRFQALSLGTRFIAIARPLEGINFKLVCTVWGLFSWGVERVWIQELCA